eukprot:scaffold4840_cov92-Phaeocystis_antarctica.AAC.1
MPFAVAAHVQLARHRRMLGWILREEAHPIGCCVVTHRSMVYSGEAAASARSTRLSMTDAASGPTRCRGGRVRLR